MGSLEYLSKFRVRFVCVAPIKREYQKATGTQGNRNTIKTAMFFFACCFALVASVLGKYI